MSEVESDQEVKELLEVNGVTGNGLVVKKQIVSSYVCYCPVCGYEQRIPASAVGRTKCKSCSRGAVKTTNVRLGVRYLQGVLLSYSLGRRHPEIVQTYREKHGLHQKCACCDFPATYVQYADSKDERYYNDERNLLFLCKEHRTELLEERGNKPTWMMVKRWADQHNYDFHKSHPMNEVHADIIAKHW